MERIALAIPTKYWPVAFDVMLESWGVMVGMAEREAGTFLPEVADRAFRAPPTRVPLQALGLTPTRVCALAGFLGT